MDGYTEAERLVLQTATSAGPDGIPFKLLEHKLADSVGVRECKEAIRNLLQGQKIKMEKNSSNQTIITAVRAPMTDNFSHVLALIRQAGTQGIDAVSIASQTKIMKAEITKALSHLIQQKQIKETRSFSNKARKIYLLAELEPSSDVTGGTFYDQSRDLDQRFIDSLRAHVKDKIEHDKVCSVAQLRAHLADAVPPDRRLSSREVAIVARTLELDGILQRTGRTYFSPRDCAGQNSTALALVLGMNKPSSSSSTALTGGDSARNVLLDDFNGVTYHLGAKESSSSSSSSSPNNTSSGAGEDLSAVTKQSFIPPAHPWTSGCPCVGCPLLDVCDPNNNGVVCPKQCAYYDDWLRLSSSSGTTEKAKPTAAAEQSASGVGRRSSAPAGKKATGGPQLKA